jgi:hypothetical protein
MLIEEVDKGPTKIVIVLVVSGADEVEVSPRSSGRVARATLAEISSRKMRDLV